MAVPVSKHNNDCNNVIQQRQEGKDVLSWIEKLCIHLLNDKDQSFNGEEHVLVFRITELESQDLIIGYYCYFKTNNGYTRFCVNKSVDLPTKELKELLGSNGAKWESEATQKWWEMVFINGDVAHVDEDTLTRKEVKVSEQLDTNMQEFITSIQNELGKAVKLMNEPQKPPQLDLTKISKVFVVGEYASALLPLIYALKEMFKSDVLPIIETNYNYTWQNSANCFYAPGTLLYTELNTSTKMSISDVIKLGETGIVFTVPMKEDDGKYSLPSTAIFNGCDLKWNELMKGDVQYDYKAGNLLFKRVHLSMIADGFQTIYIKCDSAVVAHSVYEKGKHKIKGLPPKKSEEEQKPTMLKPQQGKKGNGEKLTPQTGDKKDNDFLSPAHNGNSQMKVNSPKGIVYVIDTNVFLDCPNILDIVPANYRIGLIPKILDEIDGNKKKSEDLKRKATQVQKRIYDEGKKGKRIIYKEPNLKLLKGLNGANPDNKILALALTLKKDGYEPTILTSDYGLLTSATLNNVNTLELKELISRQNETERTI